MEEQFNKIKAEELEKVCVKEEHISPDHEESDINENVHIKDNIIISKEDNSEIHQKIYIKEEELSCDEDGDSETMCETNYSNGYSHASQLHMNGYSMSIDRTPVDVSVCSKSVGCKPVDFSVSVEVFLKEERDVDEACHISDGVEVEENLSNLRKVEETFGNHFLTAYDEPQVGGQNQFEMDATGLIPEIEHSENEQLKNQGVLNDGSKNPLYKKQENGAMKCFRCNYSTYVRRRLDFHIKRSCSVMLETFSCIHCDYKTKYKRMLRHHVILKHSFGNAVIECPHCKFLSLSFLEVQDHIQEKHIRRFKYYRCDQCDWKNRSKGNLEYHIAAKHSLQKEFVCTLCDFKCFCAINLRSHKINYHKMKIPCLKRRKKTFFF